MSDQKNGNANEIDNVVQGPWSKSKRKVKVPNKEFLQRQENMEFAEELNQRIIVQMIHSMGENGIRVRDESFIRDLGLIIELIKGSIYRGMGIPHPTHAFFETLVDLSVDENKNIHAQIDLSIFDKIIECIKYFENLEFDDDPPEVS